MSNLGLARYNATQPTVTDGKTEELQLDVNGNLKVSQSSSTSSSSVQSQGTDATGQDAYATIKTPSANATHAYISLEGSNAAIISFDAGTTDHITVQAGSIVALDNITITASTAIQAKNRTAGSNYTNLNISVW